MKTFTAAALLVAAVSARSTPIRARDEIVVLPSALALHDVVTGNNAPTFETDTARNNGFETSTLYSITFPESLAGLTCYPRFFAGRSSDVVSGTGELDFFTTGITDLANQHSGNLRDQDEGRVKFEGIGNFFSFDSSVPSDVANGFPCPAGVTGVIESVAVGESDLVSVGQDFAGSWTPAQGTPEGLSIVAY